MARTRGRHEAPDDPRPGEGLVRIGAVVFGVGVVGVLLAVVPFFFGRQDAPSWTALTASLLPVGLMQVHAAVSEGFWYARSAEFLQQPLMQLLVWLRMPGDIVFSVGVLLLALFVAKLWLGRGRKQEAALPAGAETVRR